jgi:hypothetical protein
LPPDLLGWKQKQHIITKFMKDITNAPEQNIPNKSPYFEKNDFIAS